jgi:hypothetical protein
LLQHLRVRLPALEALLRSAAAIAATELLHVVVTLHGVTLHAALRHRTHRVGSTPLVEVVLLLRHASAALAATLALTAAALRPTATHLSISYFPSKKPSL